MKIKAIILFSLLLFILISCDTSKNIVLDPTPAMYVEPISNMEVPADSILMYALPQNRLKFIVTAQKTIRKRGPLYRYSERFIGIRDVILNDEVKFKVTNIRVEVSAEPDAKKYYRVISRKGSVPAMNLSGNGLIQSFNAPKVSIEEEIILREKTRTAIDTSFKYTPYLEDQVVVNSTAKMAEEAANFIYRLRDNRAALVSGELNFFPSDGKALAIGLEETAKLEKEFLALFIGKEASEEVEFTIDYLPEKEMTKSLLFRFSQFKGVVDKGDLSGSPYYLSLVTKSEPIFINDTLPKPNYKGLFYNIPAEAEIMLTDGNNPVFSKKVLMAQFGTTLSLPVELMDQSSVIFYEETGAIQTISKN